MSRNHALLIGTALYEDETYPALPSVRADVHFLSQVLELPAVGRYEKCERVEDSTKTVVRQEVERFLNDREPDELVVVYLSGHGAYDQEDGQLYFVAADTRADRLPQTGVSAAYLTEQLEACAARRKVLVLDCCFSGRAVQGFRSKGPTEERAVPVIEASGVYVLTASQQWEAAYTAAVDQPSQFTKAMVDGLHSGRADTDSDGMVSADDLFRYVSRAMKDAPDGRRQTPTKSSLHVTGDVYLARSAVGKQVPRLEPLPTTGPASADSPGVAPLPPAKEAATEHDDTAFDAADWERLLTYYLNCLHYEASNDDMLALNGADPPRALWPAGKEVLLSGETTSVPAPQPIAELAEQARKDGADLWYGYPTVVVFEGRQQKCAPLVMQQIEVTQDERGCDTVVPSGPVVPHPALVLERLGRDEGLDLLSGFQPGWRPGFRDDMMRELRALLQQLNLSDTEHLDPGALGSGDSLRSAHEGARNLALVYAVRADSPAARRLAKDYATMRSQIGGFAGTALGALAEGSQPDDDAERDVQIVSPLPLNEGQEAVIRAALTRRLTVATGPPGTGKTQLIVNTVATARAAGKTVLVASTNNKAVDEVWERCEELMPGLVVRTGSPSGERNNIEAELSSLQQLARSAPPVGSSAMQRGEVRNRQRARDDERRSLAAVARRERTLADLGRRRHAYADRQKCDVPALVGGLGDDEQLARWQRTARRAARAWLFGALRRRRALRKLGPLPVEAQDKDGFARLVAFVQDQTDWLRLTREAEAEPDDGQLLAGLRAADQSAQEAAVGLLQALVPEQAAAGRGLIADRIEAVLQRSPREWATLDRVLPYVPGWAVTTRSVRPRFRDRAGLFDLVIVDEATQCSTMDVLPLLFRARQALVIGDPMQLPPITRMQPQQEAQARKAAGVRASWLDEHRLEHRQYSSFHAAAHAAGRPLLLDEHFRCHPDIVGVSNQHCYGGRLTVLTDPEGLQSLDGIEAVRWRHVSGVAMRGRNGSWINSEEADQVRKSVEWLLKNLPGESTIGVVTPFRAQKELITGLLADEPRVRVGTVHTFQGGQQNVMLLSLVAGEQMAPRSVNWLCREVNLWNVAITRARSHLIVFGDQGFWTERSGMPRALLAAASGEPSLPYGAVEQDEERVLVTDRLQELLAEAAPDALLDREGTADGYPFDLAVRRNDDRFNLRLDHGWSAGDGHDPARHLRLQLLRTALLPSGVRVPAWHVWDGRAAEPAARPKA
ncbi:caspase, EACC1-associated type [Streptomyces violens]|uniref:caspase, EACC1-associated type n=1 Tax=Streptomyces violens TaxID=66377 RepID=UPI0004BE7E6E|nr:AAA domain-containing protein [Streptomyces violens]